MEAVIHSNRREGEWILSVRDDVVGAEPGYDDRIFVIFQRLRTGNEYPGTGISLSVCN